MTSRDFEDDPRLWDLLGLAVDKEPAWQDRALCAQTDPEAFFPGKGGSTRKAKRLCVGCEVRAECLEYALSRDERFGIWGGLSERERRRLRPVVDQVGDDPDEPDEVVVARLVAGQPVAGPSRREVALAAVVLHQAGQGSRRISALLGVHERQVFRWLARHRAGRPLTGPKRGRTSVGAL